MSRQKNGWKKAMERGNNINSCLNLRFNFSFPGVLCPNEESSDKLNKCLYLEDEDIWINPSVCNDRYIWTK